MTKRQALLVAGLGYGDEGKGTTVDSLCRRESASLVVRYNGGAQAAHNVVLPDGRHHCFAQFGSGTFAGARTHLSRFMLVNPLSLTNEAAGLQKVGVSNPFEGFTVEADALVTTPFHIAANRLREIARSGVRHGSCGMGIGETTKDSLDGRATLRVKDLTDSDRCRSILEQQVFEKTTELKPLYELAAGTATTAEGRARVDAEWRILMDSVSIDRTLEGFARFSKHAKVVGPEWLEAELRKDQTVVFEGAQGVLLDQNYGFHPHTTWTDITYRNAMALLDGYQGQVTRLGITRSYMTRHGAGPFVTQFALRDSWGPWVQHDHNVKNQWQEDFRPGFLDLLTLNYAIEVLGGIDGLVMTNLDIPTLSICDGYINGYTAYPPNPEYFDIDGSHVVRIHVKKPWSLDHQEGLANALRGMLPRFDQPVSRQSVLFAFDVASRLGTRLHMISHGPTHHDKHLVL